MTEPNQIEIPPGLIFCTTYGVITMETAQTMVNLMRHMERQGLQNIDMKFVHGNLVDKARNEAVQQLLQSKAQWLWFIDADMAFDVSVLDLMIRTAFSECQWADIVGAYCNLRGPPYLPTIDRGTGTWETVDPGIGPVEVMRTGAACVLIKRHVLEKMREPWYGVRPVPRAIDVIYEMDNYANQRFDGVNPLRKYDEWKTLEKCAVEETSVRPALSTVGEDSGFCDRAKGMGFRIVVQTNAITSHIDRKTILPLDFQEAMKERREAEDAVCGITG